MRDVIYRRSLIKNGCKKWRFALTPYLSYSLQLSCFENWWLLRHWNKKKSSRVRKKPWAIFLFCFSTLAKCQSMSFTFPLWFRSRRKKVNWWFFVIIDIRTKKLENFVTPLLPANSNHQNILSRSDEIKMEYYVDLNKPIINSKCLTC